MGNNSSNHMRHGENLEIPDTQAFANALLDPDKETPAGITGPDGKPAPKRFSVYRNNVALSLREALEQTYPGIRKIVGEENFNILASCYFTVHPPTSPMMQAYGDLFPQFLKNFEPLQHSPFLADLACLEKAWIDAYHASDRAILDAADLSGIEAENLMETRFVTHPAAAIIESRYHLFDLFSHRAEDDGTAVSYEMAEFVQAVLVTRPYLKVQVNKLDHAASVFFTMVINGCTLGESVEKAMKQDAGFDAAGAIALMLSSGTMSSLSNLNKQQQKKQ